MTIFFRKFNPFIEDYRHIQEPNLRPNLVKIFLVHSQLLRMLHMNFWIIWSTKNCQNWPFFSLNVLTFGTLDSKNVGTIVFRAKNEPYTFGIGDLKKKRSKTRRSLFNKVLNYLGIIQMILVECLNIKMTPYIKQNELE